MSFSAFPLAGKLAVVFGGTGGIGLAVGDLFAKAGARVAVIGNQDHGKASLVSSMLSGEGHAAYTCRIENTAELNELAKKIAEQMGAADIVVNAAGFTRSIPHGDLEAMDDDTFDQILKVNTRAAFSVVRAFAEQLRSKSDGLVVNISSIASTTAVGSCIAYCAAKAGLDVMGAALARALAPEIRVLTVSPGLVDTDFVPGRDQAARQKLATTVPIKRLCSPEEVAEAVLACAVHLRFSTGSVIQVDGGRHLV
jgi:3-oxoacyl-[acyl-carrier protein] reductase